MGPEQGPFPVLRDPHPLLPPPRVRAERCSWRLKGLLGAGAAAVAPGRVPLTSPYKGP